MIWRPSWGARARGLTNATVALISLRQLHRSSPAASIRAVPRIQKMSAVPCRFTMDIAAATCRQPMQQRRLMMAARPQQPCAL